jgi:hypothetical protein
MEQLPDLFVDVAKVTRIHVQATNAPSRIDMSSAPTSIAASRKKRGNHKKPSTNSVGIDEKQQHPG